MRKENLKRVRILDKRPPYNFITNRVIKEKQHQQLCRGTTIDVVK
jgi:hypothetical protein